jgi:hypothetical protein
MQSWVKIWEKMSGCGWRPQLSGRLVIATIITTSLCATISAQDLPIAQAHRRNSGSWHRIFEMYARLSHDLFLSLRGKLKEQESELILYYV